MKPVSAKASMRVEVVKKVLAHNDNRKNVRTFLDARESGTEVIKVAGVNFYSRKVLAGSRGSK